jgi:hypothetical protein
MSGSRIVTMPMQGGMCVQSRFEPVYHAYLPLDYAELCAAVDEINDTFRTAHPTWLCGLSILFPVSGICCVFLGMYFMVTSTSDSFNTDNFGPSTLALGLVVGGMLLLMGGGIGGACLRSSLQSSAISAVHRKISELNARYAARGVDFQLHESRHLEYYRSSLNDSDFHHRHGGYRSVTTYTLVVQALDAYGRRTIPEPAEARRTFEDALQGVAV